MFALNERQAHPSGGTGRQKICRSVNGAVLEKVYMVSCRGCGGGGVTGRREARTAGGRKPRRHMRTAEEVERREMARWEAWCGRQTDGMKEILPQRRVNVVCRCWAHCMVATNCTRQAGMRIGAQYENVRATLKPARKQQSGGR